MSKTLTGKVALVTGGSRGLGAATAAALADQGADVAISYVASEEKAAAVGESLKAKGVIANIHAAAKVLPEGGRIISIGWGLGTRVAFPGTADYAATKAAVVGYSKGAARDLGGRNITVNVVQAGMMDTDMAAGSKGKLPPIIMESHAIHRFAELSEVAAAVVFLAGPDARFITGSIIDVNGGFTA